MAEFRKLSDVEVVAKPTNSANVLIEENGVIKKAPKTAVGGGGSEELYITFDSNNYDYDIGSHQILSATENLYKKLKEKWDKHIGFTVGIYGYDAPDERCYRYEHSTTYTYTDDQGVLCFVLAGGSYEAAVYENGTIRAYYYD
jgi:hypothetical protein